MGRQKKVKRARAEHYGEIPEFEENDSCEPVSIEFEQIPAGPQRVLIEQMRDQHPDGHPAQHGRNFAWIFRAPELGPSMATMLSVSPSGEVDGHMLPGYRWPS